MARLAGRPRYHYLGAAEERLPLAVNFIQWSFTRAAGSMAKLIAGETAVRAAKQAIQILGGDGYTRNCPVERWHRDA